MGLFSSISTPGGTSGLGGYVNDATFGDVGAAESLSSGKNPLSGPGQSTGAISNYAASKDPTNNNKQNSANSAAASAISNENTANQTAINNLGTAGTTYTGGLAQATNGYNSSILNNTNQSIYGQNGQGGGLQDYANSTNTALGTLGTQANSNASGAETLQQLQNPNTNPWSQNVQSAYNNQAQGIQNQGLASYGVLAGLGSQATANTIGGAGLPLTGGQEEAIQSSNLGQAGNEFANAQSQANTLRQNGLQAGINQANTAYGFGQQANQQAVSDQQAIAGNEQGYNNAIYNEQNTQATDAYNANSGLASAVYGTQVGQTNAQLGQNDAYYGAQQGLATGEAASAAAQQNANINALAGLGGKAISSAAPSNATSSGGSSGGGLASAAALGLTNNTAAPGAASSTTEDQAGPDYNSSGAYGAQNPTALTAQKPYSGVQGGYSAYGANGAGGYQPGASLAQNPYSYDPYGQAA